MRSSEELEEAFKAVGDLLGREEHEDDEVLQAIYDTLRWCDGASWENTVAGNLPL